MVPEWKHRDADRLGDGCAPRGPGGSLQGGSLQFREMPKEAVFFPDNPHFIPLFPVYGSQWPSLPNECSSETFLQLSVSGASRSWLLSGLFRISKATNLFTRAEPGSVAEGGGPGLVRNWLLLALGARFARLCFGLTMAEGAEARSPGPLPVLT